MLLIYLNLRKVEIINILISEMSYTLGLKITKI